MSVPMRACESCHGTKEQITRFVYMADTVIEDQATPCSACNGTGEQQVREFVPREATSWHIGALALKYWNDHGIPLEKAHRIKATTDERGRTWHRPVCGAPMVHASEQCAMASVGWPQCKKCSKKAGENVPSVFAQIAEMDFEVQADERAMGERGEHD